MKKIIMIIIGIGVLVTLMSTFVSSLVYAQEDETAKVSEHLLTIHDAGEKVTLLTTKHNLGEALEEIGVTLSEYDTTEPGLDHELKEKHYYVTIYRARPVTILDGDAKYSILSAHREANKIVQDSGVEVRDEDILDVALVFDQLSGFYVEQLNIQRAKKVQLDLYGEKTDVYTQASSVSEFLEEKGIVLGQKDKMSLSSQDAIGENTSLRIWREGVQTVTKKEKVDFDIEKVEDADQNIGYEKITTEGVRGEKKVTYEVKIVNGKEVSRKEIASVVTKKPVKQVMIVGTKSPLVPYTGGGDKTTWLTASNIPEDMWGYADAIVTRESTWNPNATNASSGACGLAQALPCSKVSGNPYNPVDSLNWMNDYVNGRYGGWKQAYDFWNANHWY